MIFNCNVLLESVILHRQAYYSLYDMYAVGEGIWIGRIIFNVVIDAIGI